MRKVLTAAVIILCITSSAFNKAEKESYIYVYRGGQWGSALNNFTIYLDEKKICKLSNGKYFKLKVTPGKHEIEAKMSGVSVMKKETFIQFEVEEGKDNFIACTVKRSVTRARLEMSEVVANQGKKDISDMKEDNCRNGDDEK